jgi:integrase
VSWSQVTNLRRIARAGSGGQWLSVLSACLALARTTFAEPPHAGDFTLLMTLCSTGLRRVELCRLKVGGMDSKRTMPRVVEGKGGIDREVPLPLPVEASIRDLRSPPDVSMRNLPGKVPLARVPVHGSR